MKKRRVLSIAVGILLTGVMLFALIWPFRIHPVSDYQVRRPCDIPIPVMSMSEYSKIVSEHPRPYHLGYDAGSGSLLCFGISDHVNDPQHEDIASIIDRFETFAPTIALIEGRLGLSAGRFTDAVQQFGESGAVFVLARNARIPVYTLELPLADEVAGVLEQFTPQQTALFYILRPYFGKRRHGPVDDPAGAIAGTIRRRTRVPGLEGTFDSVADIDAFWQREFPDLPDWRDCDDRYGWPGYLNDIGARANEVRNIHWIQTLVELVREGHRVFATCGCSHAVRMEPALDALLRPTSVPAITEMSDFHQDWAASDELSPDDHRAPFPTLNLGVST